MAVSVEQAANNAFATYLGAQLVAAGYAGGTAVSVEPRWPDPDKQLPTRAVSLILAGRRDDVLFDPYVVSTVAVDGATFTTTWAVASVDQPVQLDVWARDDYARDDLVATVNAILLKSGGANITASHGVLVDLDDGWSGKADFLFDGPERLETPASRRETDYRAIFRGRSTALLTVTATSGRMANLIARRRLYQQDPASGPYDVVTMTTGGRTSSQS